MNVPRTAHIQAFVNVGAEITGFDSARADIYLVFPTANVSVKWLKLGMVAPAIGADVMVASNHYNSSASTSLSRYHVKVEPVLYQINALLTEAMLNGSGIVDGPVMWSVTDLDGNPTNLASIDGSGVLSVAGIADGSIRVVASYSTPGGPISGYQTVELRNQAVAANTNPEAVVICSGWDLRPQDISWGPNQFSKFGSIYQKNGTLLLSAVTYPFVTTSTPRPVTFTGRRARQSDRPGDDRQAPGRASSKATRQQQPGL